MLVSSSAVFANAIDVNVNGHPVSFPDAQPIERNGVLMVPIRPLLEHMQIRCEFDASTGQITASEADKQAILTLGSATVDANGTPMTLDAAAMMKNGRAYVPLRSFAEAMGAMVDFDKSAQVLEINGRVDVSTGAAEDPIANITPALALDSEYKSWYTSGETLQFSLQANPGITPTLYLDGGATALPMTEAHPGHYTASYTVPAGETGKAIYTTDAPYASVNYGDTNLVASLNQSLMVDNTAPMIAQVNPGADGRPVIEATLTDEGSGLDASSVSVTVDGSDVTSDAWVSGDTLTYQANSGLQTGNHSYRITVKDLAGNISEQSGSFTVGENQILSTTETTTEIREVVPNPIIVEPTPEYTIPEIPAFLPPTLDDEYSYGMSNGRLSVTGMAPGAKSVRLWIRPVFHTEGMYQTYGYNKKVEVEVNADGTFSAENIRMGTAEGKYPEQFLVKFRSVSPSGEESEEVEKTLDF